MGGIVDRFWAADGSTKVAHGCLTHLQSWSREDLRHSFENFRSAGGHAVNCRQLGQILRISNFHLTKDIFDLLLGPEHTDRGLLDFWSVIGPMVVMSGQHYISRVSFLFSIFDMDGDGCLNESEIILAVRSVFFGLARFFPKASLPDVRRLEHLAQEMFQRFDADGSGLVSIGEIVNYAYRSEGLLRLCEPFPSREKQVHEEPVHFIGSSASRGHKAHGRLGEPSLSLRRDLRLAPDPSPPQSQGSASSGARSRHYDKPWQRAANRDGLTKAHAWVAWICFRLFADKENPRIIHATELMNLVSRGRVKVFPMINAAVEESRDLAENIASEHDELGADRLVVSVSQAMLAKDFAERLERLSGPGTSGEAGEGGLVSMRSFLCLLWPKASDGAIECCVRWCQSFHAHQVLASLLRQKRASMRQSRFYRNSIEDPMAMQRAASGRQPVAVVDSLSREDLQVLFEALDFDGNGKLSARELCTRGGLSTRDAQKLLRIWDQDADGELTSKELSSVVQAVDPALKQQVKASAAKRDAPGCTNCPGAASKFPATANSQNEHAATSFSPRSAARSSYPRKAQVLNQLQMLTKSDVHMAEGVKYMDMKEKMRQMNKDQAIMLGPFDACKKLLTHSEGARLSFRDRLDLFFVDHSLMGLLVHENYLNAISKKPVNNELLQRCANSADMMAVGDIIGARIREHQEWSLLPDLGILSAVYPAFTTHGLRPQNPRSRSASKMRSRAWGVSGFNSSSLGSAGCRLEIRAWGCICY
ncbi:Gnf1 [Symbiodinium microadriaticum]|nr:Gnf1 [Symbiodinium microadriaticum]